MEVADRAMGPAGWVAQHLALEVAGGGFFGASHLPY